MRKIRPKMRDVSLKAIARSTGVDVPNVLMPTTLRNMVTTSNPSGIKTTDVTCPCISGGKIEDSHGLVTAYDSDIMNKEMKCRKKPITTAPKMRMAAIRYTRRSIKSVSFLIFAIANLIRTGAVGCLPLDAVIPDVIARMRSRQD